MTNSKPAGMIAAALLVAAASILYTTGLDLSPPYLMHDELQFSLQARSIAETGRDLSGRALPVFFTEPEFPPGRDPVLIYFAALVIKVTSFSQENVKLAVALIGIFNIALMFVAGWKLLGNPWWGVLAAALLALTPIHFIRARLVLSPFTSIPFVLGWIIAFTIYQRSGSRRALLAATASAALSMYSYLACVMMAPVYLLIALWSAVKREGWKVVTPMAITIALVLAPMAVWYVTHPERYAQLVDAYRLYGSGAASAPAPILAPGTPAGPQQWLALIWQFLSPDFLFLSGDSSLVNSTRTAGLFPIAFAVLMVAGAWRSATSTDVALRAAAIGLLTAPVASILSGAVEMNRIMFVIPFGVLMAAVGARSLIARGGAWRIACILLLLSVPLQFAGFHRHYLNEYPRQAARWFGGNVRAAVLAASRGTGPVYLSSHIPFVNRYWAFYVPGDANRVQFFSDGPVDAPVGSRAACAAENENCQMLGRTPGWQLVDAIGEPSGESSFLIFARQ